MQQLGIFSGLVSTASSSINSPWLTALSASMAETNQSIGLEGGAVEGKGEKERGKGYFCIWLTY